MIYTTTLANISNKSYLGLTYLLVISLFVFVAGCTESAENIDPGTNPVFSVTNTSQSLLIGHNIGNDFLATNDFRKLVDFSVTNPDPRLSFGHAYVSKKDPYTDAVYWMIFVTNTSDQTLCFIRLTNGIYKNSSGQTIATDDFNYVHGSVRRFSLSDIETNTCLLPDQKGLFSGIEILSGLYSNLSEIVFESIHINDSGPTEASLPYIVHGGTFFVAPYAGAIQTITLPIKNIGTERGLIDNLSQYVLVDANGNPLSWGYFGLPINWNGVLDVDEEGTLTDSYSYFGIANRLYVYIDYETYIPLNKANDYYLNEKLRFMTRGSRNKYIRKFRNDREQYKNSFILP